MRRLSGLLVAGALMLLPAFSQGHDAAHAQAAPALTFDGDVALWSVTIKPDQTAAFEDIMSRVREALMKSDKPERKQQAAGWKVFKMANNPLKDGSVLYTHVIEPVKGADYTILTILYEATPDPAEQRKLFDQYRAAFGTNLGTNTGGVAVDLSKQ